MLISFCPEFSSSFHKDVPSEAEGNESINLNILARSLSSKS